MSCFSLFLCFTNDLLFIVLSFVQVEPAPKVGISDAMRERLMREASAGLDSEEKQTNVLLYISIGVALLVILGGQGILY